MTITHTITTLELIWTIIALLGSFFIGSLAYKALMDREWLIETNANGDHDLRTYVATTSILIFVGGLITQLGYMTVGIMAMTQPNPHDNITPHPIQIATSSIFIVASISSTVLAVFISIRRDKAVKLIQEKLAHHENV